MPVCKQIFRLAPIRFPVYDSTAACRYHHGRAHIEPSWKKFRPFNYTFRYIATRSWRRSIRSESGEAVIATEMQIYLIIAKSSRQFITKVQIKPPIFTFLDSVGQCDSDALPVTDRCLVPGTYVSK